MFAEAIIRWRKTRDLRRVAHLTRAQLEAEKLAGFRRLVQHAHAHSPYYRRIIAERSIDVASCTPLDFPVLTKSLLMRHFDEIVTAPGVTKSAIAEFLTRSHDPSEHFLGRYRVIHTSGSSGEVGYFVYPAAIGHAARPCAHPPRAPCARATPKASSAWRITAPSMATTRASP